MHSFIHSLFWIRTILPFFIVYWFFWLLSSAKCVFIGVLDVLDGCRGDHDVDEGEGSTTYITN